MLNVKIVKNMNEIRIKIGNEIEVLTNKLKAFGTDQHGFSNDPEVMVIGEKIDDLERELSETWLNQ
jgi:hypothetical protein